MRDATIDDLIELAFDNEFRLAFCVCLEHVRDHRIDKALEIEIESHETS
jgi:hypothetical protein